MAEGLEGLGDPTLVEDILYQDAFDALVDDFQDADPTYIGFQDSDPLIINLSVVAGKEVEIRKFVNQAVKSTFLKFATGTALDNIGALWGVFRLVVTPAQPNAVPPVAEVLESDEAFRERICDKIEAPNNAATEGEYEFFAKQCSADVDSVTVTKPIQNDNLVQIAIKSVSNDGIASPALLAELTECLNHKDIRAINDRLDIVGATNIGIDVEANITMLEGASDTIFDDLNDSFTEAFQSINDMGRDITLSWITDTLHIGAGVYKVEIISPSADVLIQPDEFATLSSLTLTKESLRNF